MVSVHFNSYKLSRLLLIDVRTVSLSFGQVSDMLQKNPGEK